MSDETGNTAADFEAAKTEIEQRTMGKYGQAITVSKVFASLIILWFFGACAFFFIAATTGHDTYVIFNSTTTPIASISDSTATNGRFTLFHGFVQETPYFYFYTIDKSKSGKEVFHLNRIPADPSITDVIDDENEHPYLVTNRYMRIHTDWFTEHGIIEYVPTPTVLHITYEFHVPEGTVRQVYNLDTNMRN